TRKGENAKKDVWIPFSGRLSLSRFRPFAFSRSQSLRLLASIRVLLRGRGGGFFQHAEVAGIAGLEEELRLLDELVRRLLARVAPVLSDRLVRPEEVVGEVAALERVEDELRVVEVRPELAHDVVRLLEEEDRPVAQQRCRPVEHRL